MKFKSLCFLHIHAYSIDFLSCYVKSATTITKIPAPMLKLTLFAPMLELTLFAPLTI